MSIFRRVLPIITSLAFFQATELRAELCESFRKAVASSTMQAYTLDPVSNRARSKILKVKLLEDYDNLKLLLKKDNFEVTDTEIKSLVELKFALYKAPSLKSFSDSIQRKLTSVRNSRKAVDNHFIFSKEVKKELNNRTVFEKVFWEKALLQIYKNPQVGQTKIGIPNKFRFHKFSYRGTVYIAAYTKAKDSNKTEIVYMHSHENFYTNFRRLLK